ncbi:hypothetical protein B0H63DRAFT_517801 [Podospora didyma]|uniref:Uncharacterized protein n=1 Tax=Podospora didyma TaxID=330526 RepID=A0AAE0P7G2_9PEZI|nr:hypothetical protein B0H63DRAFT_517801 [Podospora didyma]
MAQKSQNVSHSEERLNLATRTSSAKDGAGASATSSSTRHPTTSAAGSGSISSILPRMSDPIIPPSAASSISASPQPMDKSALAGSHAAASSSTSKDTASPYGTRSRNRTSLRPNYAEDKDIDVDIFELYPERREDDPKKIATRHAASSSAAVALSPQAAATAAANSSSSSTASSASSATVSAAPPSLRPTNGSARKPLPSDDSKFNASQGSAKEHHHSHNPSSAASSVNGGNGPAPVTDGRGKGKKRKAEAAAAQTASGSQTPQASHATSTAVSKRHGTGTSSQHAGNNGGYGETNLLTFENSKARLRKDGKMVADDGTVLEVNDHVYLVCEPPGEPYYLGRIMEFLHAKNDNTLPIDALRINWYYRPKDIGRKVQDTRLVFATMHSDISPLTSLRGKCQIRHKTEITNLAEYKRAPDCFWYEKLYDRYIQKNYEVIPTVQIINVPEHVKRVLDERWKYILVEQGRGKELTSAVKTCKRCSGYCASNDSVGCAVCEHTYHMNCVKPPLLKKPSRGFAWSCAACSRAQERKLEARNTPNAANANHDADDEEYPDDEEDDVVPGGVETGRTSRTSPSDEDAHQPATAEQIYHASLWPYRYLGIHCKVEDALDYDDRIFPRASTRLGPRHQAVVLPWYGRPVQYVKPLEFGKKNGKKDAKLNKEQQAALEAERIRRERRPKYVQDEPPGWIERGGDDTVTPLFIPPAKLGVLFPEDALDDYMESAKSMADKLHLPPRSTNLQDVARDVLFRNQFDPEKALKELAEVPKAEFKEPELTPAEQKKFEEGVAKFGSELHSVKKHVKTLTPATVVRYYYTWKKTDRGKQIWGNYAARKGKKDAKKAADAAKLMADDVADSADDSAFDTGKASHKRKEFICKFCTTRTSRQWRRAPNAASAALVTENGGRGANKDKGAQYIQALCRRCAELWRRYAIQWEAIEEVAKKVAQTGGGRGWRRKVDDELYQELLSADEMINNTRLLTPDPVVAAPSPAASVHAVQEPPRKKLKGLPLPDKDPDQTASDSGSISSAPHPKKKEKIVVEKPPPPPPPETEILKPRLLPCAICLEMEPLGDQHVSCRECRLTVHRNCYGILDNRAPNKWTCDMCLNDKSPQVSINYKCVLCPVEDRHHDFVEPPKVTHKKRTEKDRERERIDRENAVKAAEYYRKRQEDMNRPVNPREPLKRTADNNWVHVTCAVWTPEVKFGHAKALGPSEGIPSIPRARYAEECKVCKSQGGACVHCHHCRAAVHVECAHQAGYVLGFDITPVKGSRRDQFNIVSINGETGTMSAAIWCKDHEPTKTIVHRMYDQVDNSGMNALQLYVQNFKQADLTLTGCARKANQITFASSRNPASTSPPANQQHRRSSNLANGDHSHMASFGNLCVTCGTDTTLKWYPINDTQEPELANGHYGNLGSEAKKFIYQRSLQCHKCAKTSVALPTPQVATPPRPIPQTPSDLVNSLASQEALRQPARVRYQMYNSVSRATAAEAALQAPIAIPTTTQVVSPPVQAPQTALPQSAAPPRQSSPGHPYPPRGYSNEWHRPPSTNGHTPAQPTREMTNGHGPAQPAREVNGGPTPPHHSPMPTLAVQNHLRPQPMSNLRHPSPPPPIQSGPTHNGHVAQPYVNGRPPSPRRVNSATPPTQNGGYHHGHGPPDLRPHHMGLNRHWNNHGTPHHSPPHTHHSPPLPRESISSREASIPPPLRESRPPNGASASPSLRNLLS